MADLVVEDGTARTDSNTYVSLAEADAYWELRNESSTGWGAKSDEAKTASLLRAAQFLDYAYRYVGDRYSTIQAMTWPRVVFMDADARAMYADVIPQRLKDAQCELAREDAINGPLLAPVDRGGRVQSESVGPLSVTYFADAPATKQFPLVDAILTDLLATPPGGGLTITAVRA